MRWIAGDGTRPFHDPIRVPARAGGRRPDQPVLRRLLPDDRGRRPGHRGARAHRPGALRRARGARGRVPRRRRSRPVLLADDGARRRHRRAQRRQPAQRPADAGQLRPAQRPAGRSGQPALVFTYCAAGQPARPVLLPPARADGRRARSTPPRLDLANEDLVRAHVHASGSPRPGVDLGTLARATSSTLDGERADARRCCRVGREAASTSPTSIARARPRAERSSRRIAASSTRPTGTRPAGSTRRSTRRRSQLRPRLRPLARASTAPRSRHARRQNKVISDALAAASRTRTRPSACAREAEAQLELLRGDGRAARHAVRLLQLPLLRQRGLPARLQLPAAAALGLHPGRARRARAGRVPSAARGSSPSPSSGRAASSTTRARATSINRVILPVERDEENRLPTDRGQAVRELRLPAPGRGRRARARPVRALRRAARPPLDATSSACRTWRTKRRDRINSRRGGARCAWATRSAPASASPTPDGVPSAAATPAHGGRRELLATLDLRRAPPRSGGSTSAGARREQPDAARLRPRHRARLLGAERPRTQRRPGRPDEPSQASASSPSSRTAATCLLVEPARAARPRP